MIKLAFLLALAIVSGLGKTIMWTFVGNPLVGAFPCNGTRDLYVEYEPGKAPEEENEYTVYIHIKLPKHSVIEMQFDSEAIVTLLGSTGSNGRITVYNDIFKINFFHDADQIVFSVKGSHRGTVPYFKSVKINTQEYCDSPVVGYLDGSITGYVDTAETKLKIPDGCGRRKVEHTELIVSGQATKEGDWPWHVAIYRLEKKSLSYKCGGTLISKTWVLTAAHCVTIRGAPITPEIFNIVLGKYNLLGGDLQSQEREVHSVIVHEDFAPRNYLHNDIALLKLKTEAFYNDYIQPSCIWSSQANDRLPSGTIFGMVVGWGFDETGALSSQLKVANLPIISDSTCIKANPLFYSNALGNDKKFCAGTRNGTSACNGDSGGGLYVFIPDTDMDNSTRAVGSWHIRGIVSLSISRRDEGICDPDQYTVFTDITKYTDWIRRKSAD